VKRLLSIAAIAGAWFPSNGLAADEPMVCEGDDLGECLLEHYAGLSCARTAREEGAPDPDAPADAPIENSQATEFAVYQTCQRLGCLDDPRFDDPAVGVCGMPQTPADCAGVDLVAEGGITLCAPRHEPLGDAGAFVPKRLLFTGSALLSSGVGSQRLTTRWAAGALLQIGFGRSKKKALKDGGMLHYGFPNWSLHLAGNIGDDAFGHDAQVVYKIGRSSLISRVGAGYVGFLFNDPATAPIYRFGPMAHLEVYYNLFGKGGWLPGGGSDGPVWFAGLEYSANLFDDFKQN
jgi:hypothetical protein